MFLPKVSGAPVPTKQSSSSELANTPSYALTLASRSRKYLMIVSFWCWVSCCSRAGQTYASLMVIFLPSWYTQSRLLAWHLLHLGRSLEQYERRSRHLWQLDLGCKPPGLERSGGDIRATQRGLTRQVGGLSRLLWAASRRPAPTTQEAYFKQKRGLREKSEDVYARIHGETGSTRGSFCDKEIVFIQDWISSVTAVLCCTALVLELS